MGRCCYCLTPGRSIFILALASSVYKMPDIVHYMTVAKCNPELDVGAFDHCAEYNGIFRTFAHRSSSYPHEHDLFWVNDNATSVLDRIRLYNRALTDFRCSVVQGLVSSPISVNRWAVRRNVLIREVTYKFGNDYFKELYSTDAMTHLVTIFMRWYENENSSQADIAETNLPVSRSHRWTGVKPPCLWWDATQRFVFDEAYCQPYENFTHSKYINDTNIRDVPQETIDTSLLRKYSHHVDNTSAAHYSFFVHIAIDATISPSGDVYVKSTRIRNNGCAPDPEIMRAGFSCYNEVFSISQSWAVHSFYHWMIESFPKMGLVLDFLRANPTVRIHMAKRHEQIDGIFRALQLDPERIVTGFVFGKVVYMSRPTACYEAPVLDLQVLSAEFLDYIRETSNDTSRDSVIYIQRTKTRPFANNTDTEEITRNLTARYGLRFELFTDNPQVSVNETMFMFYRARVIVAPHGAGLLNMQYSRPNTIIVEAIDNLPNCPCFLVMAHVLGHRYHAIGATGGRNIVRVNISEFERSVDFHLRYASEHASSFPLFDGH